MTKPLTCDECDEFYRISEDESACELDKLPDCKKMKEGSTTECEFCNNEFAWSPVAGECQSA
jgi:hypothetical protein